VKRRHSVNGPRSYSETAAWRRTDALLPVELQSAGSTISEEWLRVGGFDVHLDIQGKHDSPATLVVLHGGGGNGRLLAPVGKLAAAAGFRAIAPDLPGYGLTVVPRKRSLVYDDWRNVAAAVVEHAARDTDRVIVIGMSMGGMLAYDSAARTRIPSAVIATCLMDPSLREARRQMVRWPLMVKPTEVLMRFPMAFDRIPIKMTLASNMRAIANDLRIAQSIISDRRSGGGWMPGSWIRTFLSSSPEVRPEDFDVCPVTLAHPAADRWTDLSVSRPFLERINRVTTSLVMLEKAGHFPVEEPGRHQLRDVAIDALANFGPDGFSRP
jgi:alpha-beta hydrolase superfamily lysophospholipase